jgi:hypothetical protein
VQRTSSCLLWANGGHREGIAIRDWPMLLSLSSKAT